MLEARQILDASFFTAYGYVIDREEPKKRKCLTIR
jgi:hypothetical protein